MTLGRESFADWRWADAYRALSEADRLDPLGPEDLELLSTSAYMLGRVPQMLEGLERAHHGYLERGNLLPAIKAAIWLGTNLAQRGKMGPATGWIARAQRLLESDEQDCVERGYLLLPLFFKHEAAGEFDTVIALANEATAIGRRFGDADLIGLALHTEGRALVKIGQANDGLAILDEVMVSVTGGELSPVVTGLVYCSVIEGCYEVHEIRRARDWTAALSQWCDDQPDLVAFTGQCLAHRAEILQLQGTWSDALAEAQKAHDRHARGPVAAQAFYQQAEVHRLRGEYHDADAAYRGVAESGGDPQPGLARLRLAQGNVETAAAGISRAEAEATGVLMRARLLPAYLDIMLAARDLEAADAAGVELAQISDLTGVDLHRATAAFGQGACDLARGDSAAALRTLRAALRLWLDLEVPYEAALTRTLIGQCLTALGDDEAATVEYHAARVVFDELGAAPDRTRLKNITMEVARASDHGLTGRELEVLRLLTTGATNRAIATELVLSERTVDRHASNIYAKLGVSSRAAATAYAYQHELM